MFRCWRCTIWETHHWLNNNWYATRKNTLRCIMINSKTSVYFFDTAANYDFIEINRKLSSDSYMLKLQFNIKTSWMYSAGFNWDGHILITTYLRWMLLLFIDYQTLLYLPVAYSVLTWHPFLRLNIYLSQRFLGMNSYNNIKLMTYCMRWIQKFIMLILDKIVRFERTFRIVNQKIGLLYTLYQHCHQRTLFLF